MNGDVSVTLNAGEGENREQTHRGKVLGASGQVAQITIDLGFDVEEDGFISGTLMI